MKENAPQKLIFIYNAETGFRNQIWDGAHKILSPSTYTCNLCALTHGAFSEKSSWKMFRGTSGMEMEFMHKNEFQKMYASKFGHKYEFPIILLAQNNELEVLIGTKELNSIENSEELIKMVIGRARN